MHRVAKLRYESLHESLERIKTLEHLLMPARVAFGYLLTQNSQSVASVAGRIAKEWKRPPRIDRNRLESIRPQIADVSGSQQTATRWLDIAGSLESADYTILITTRRDEHRHHAGAQRVGSMAID
jgi:hypothetical protein